MDDAYILIGLALLFVLSPTNLQYQFFLGTLIAGWLIALCFPKSLAWADVMFLPVLMVFCLSLYTAGIAIPFALLMLIITALNWEALKKPYPAFMFFFFIYASVYISHFIARVF